MRQKCLQHEGIVPFDTKHFYMIKKTLEKLPYVEEAQTLIRNSQ